MDISQPGYYEQLGPNIIAALMGSGGMGSAANDLASALSGSAPAGDYWAGVQGMAGNMPGVSNRADEAYQLWSQSNQDLPQLPGLDPYYDRQRDTMMAELNSQLAASGLAGSSRGASLKSDALIGLGSEQANREADYALALDEARRANLGLGGYLGAGADVSSGRQADTALEQLLGFGDLASAAGNEEIARALGIFGGKQAAASDDLDRLGLVSDIGSGVQGAREGRIEQAFGAHTAIAPDLAGTVGGGTNALLAELMGVEQSVIELALKGDEEALNQLRAAGASLRGDIGAGAELAGALVGSDGV
jgi:hypothetical protein